MAHQTLLTDNEDLAWLLDTHLAGRGTPIFRSAMIYGNEDCPQRIELFEKQEPLIDDPIVAAYELTDDMSYARVA